MELGGEQPRETKKRWAARIQGAEKLYFSIAFEEMMAYVDKEENQNFERVKTETPAHTPTPVPKSYHT